MEMIDDELTSMEFMLLAPEQHDEHLTLLAMIAHYHARTMEVCLGLVTPFRLGILGLRLSVRSSLIRTVILREDFERCRTEDFTIHIWWALADHKKQA